MSRLNTGPHYAQRRSVSTYYVCGVQTTTEKQFVTRAIVVIDHAAELLTRDGYEVCRVKTVSYVVERMCLLQQHRAVTALCVGRLYRADAPVI